MKKQFLGDWRTVDRTVPGWCQPLKVISVHVREKKEMNRGWALPQ